MYLALLSRNHLHANLTEIVGRIDIGEQSIAQQTSGTQWYERTRYARAANRCTGRSRAAVSLRLHQHQFISGGCSILVIPTGQRDLARDLASHVEVAKVDGVVAG